MSKVDEKVEELLAKHPHLTKPEALKIVTDKNQRKKDKRAERTERNGSKKTQR